MQLGMHFYSPMEILYNMFRKMKYNPLEDLFSRDIHGAQTCITLAVSLGICEEISD